MCGRYTLAVPPSELVESFDVPPLTFAHVPRYNVSPGQTAPVVAQDRLGRRIGLMRWGFERPGGGGGLLINARSESATDKPTFREAFRRRRCLVPADGFYEWRRQGSVKQPFWFHPAERGVVSFAGIWEGRAFTILTADANADVRRIHDRMPVTVGREDRDAWLSKDTPTPALLALLRAPPDGTFLSHAVSTRVNASSHDDPSLVEPA